MKGLYKSLCLLVILLCQQIYAQQTVVTGTIMDKEGKPVPCATVIDLQNRASGASADLDGKYSISITGRSRLQFTSIGYKTVEIDTEGRNVINVVLEEDTQYLDEVIVVGYGSVRKRDLTGAVSSVGSKDIKDMQPIPTICFLQQT